MTPTPDELRTLLDDVGYSVQIVAMPPAARRLDDDLAAFSDAWEADKFKTWQQIQVVIAKDGRIAELEKRLEAAEAPHVCPRCGHGMDEWSEWRTTKDALAGEET